jgi:hypothetical protein
MGKCKETKTLDFKNPNSILSALKNLFKLPSKPGSGIPAQLILAKQCGGFNASEIAAKIIQRQAEAGIPVGPLPSGVINPNELMERIREAIELCLEVDENQTESLEFVGVQRIAIEV